MKKLAFISADGGVSIITPLINFNEALTEEQSLARAKAKLPPGATNVVEIDDAIVPTDRTFRNAWTMNAGVISHNMTKARNIHRDRIRAARSDAFQKLDADWMKAVAAGDAPTAAAVEAQRVALRDAPADQRIENAQNVNALKAVWPTGLPRP